MNIDTFDVPGLPKEEKCKLFGHDWKNTEMFGNFVNGHFSMEPLSKSGVWNFQICSRCHIEQATGKPLYSREI